MGVTFHADGPSHEGTFDCSRAMLGEYRILLAKVLNPVAGRLYEVIVTGGADYEDIGGRDVLMLAIKTGGGQDASLGDAESVKSELRRLCPRGIAGKGLFFRPPVGDGSLVEIRVSYPALNEVLTGAYGTGLVCFLSSSDGGGDLSADDCADALHALDGIGDADDGKVFALCHHPMHGKFVGLLRRCVEGGTGLAWG